MIFKCKICAGDLAFKTGDKIATCEYCGVRQTLPQIEKNEKTAVLYERANGYRITSEFDKAANIYNQIIVENPLDGEAYWNLALCNYGVIYVSDPKTGEYIPTCNRTHYLSILNDQNYKSAIKNATAEQCVIYEKDARYIDDVQKSIVSIAKREKPFDIFICYKETMPDGKRTRDSIKAQELYDKLTNQGYKVFFSRITLESKIGTEYEPYIYAALASSKVMLHITSSRENSDAVWVRNEWSRYISFATKDTAKTLIPIYFDIDKQDLPDEFLHISAHDMKEEGFEQELIRGIKKMIPTPVMKLQRKKKRNKILRWVSTGLAACLIAGTVYTIPRVKEYNKTNEEYKAAMQFYYDKNYPEATWAFEAMGAFKDSKDMKDKSEKSWRRSLATIALNGVLGPEVLGSYYITANGTVDTFIYDSGHAHKGIDITKHGKIVSIGEAEKLYALHEDGYVDNAIENNKLKDDSEWHNIVQISPIFSTTNVALRADGKILFGNTDADEYVDDSWLKETSSWNNIIAFDCVVDRDLGGKASSAILIGIKADGTLCVATNKDENRISPALDVNFVKNSVSQFNNVVSLWSILIPNSSMTFMTLDIIALTKDKKLQMYIDGKFSELDAKDISGFYLSTEFKDYEQTILYSSLVYLLKANGDFTDYKKNKTILTDIVYIKEGVFVSRTGSIYAWKYLESKPILTEGKTRVFDEWTERLK